jgi:hypothetical protein
MTEENKLWFSLFQAALTGTGSSDDVKSAVAAARYIANEAMMEVRERGLIDLEVAWEMEAAWKQWKEYVLLNKRPKVDTADQQGKSND